MLNELKKALEDTFSPQPITPPTPTPPPHLLVILTNNIKPALIEFTIFLRNTTHLGVVCGWLASPSPYTCAHWVDVCATTPRPFISEANTALQAQEHSSMCLMQNECKIFEKKRHKVVRLK